MKRLATFLRSALPADLWQLVFLVGVVFLFTSSRLAWWPSNLFERYGLAFSTMRGGMDRLEFRSFVVACLYPIMFAGLAGYFVCFWPGKKPVRRILWAICLPTVLGLALILWKLFCISRLTSSVFESHFIAGVVLQWLWVNAWKFSSGLYFCAAGLILILIYTIRIALDAASLPISLAKEYGVSKEDPDSWLRVRRLVFVLIGPLFLFAGLIGFLAFGVPYISSWTLYPRFLTVFAKLAPLLDAVLLAGISFYIAGKPERNAARNSLRLPEPQFALVALSLAVAICAAVPTAHYLFDRAQWGAHDFGKYATPLYSDYFDLGSVWQLSILMLVFGAFAEEIVFRGMLLPEFIVRYGLHRGIFLTGIAWAAIHFRSDSYAGLSVGGVLLHLLYRVLVCLAMNYVFAWMTLRWNSVIPAAIAHTVSNMLITAGAASGEDARWEFQIVLWAVLAFLLYRFWPLKTDGTLVINSAEANPESAI